MNLLTSQIKFDENFIKKLLDKLKVGNTRSIHLNGLVGRSATRLDLCHLSLIKESLPENFLELLLNNETFLFKISFDNLDLGSLNDDEKGKLSLLSKKLNNIVIENNDNYLEFGVKNFGIGFPILIKRNKLDPSKIIKAPLFIWNLDIERSNRNKNEWIIKKEEDASIKLNELFISHILKDESIHLKKISSEILEDGILDGNELLDLCHNILSQLGVSDKQNLKIERCLDNKEIEEITNSKPWIQWSAVFGIYVSQKETIIQSTEELLENIEEFQNEVLELKKFQTSTISAIDTDPSQGEILNTLIKNEIKLIQGPPGTGKSQSITAIISNALSNKARCLVVCEKKTALDVIHNNLEKIGLGDFCILIDDVSKDRKKVIEKARNIQENIEIPIFYENEFKNNFQKYSELKKDLNKRYAEPLKKVFGDFSWKYLVGLYLRYSKSKNLDYIKHNLDYDFLSFSHEEYSKYLNIIEEARDLYEEVLKDSENIFSVISKENFKESFRWNLYEGLKIKTNNFYDFLQKILGYLDTKSNDDCELEGISIFIFNSLESSDTIVSEIITNAESIKNIYDELVKIIDDRKKRFLQILDALNDFLGQKTNKDFIKEGISIFDKESIYSGMDNLGKIIKILLKILDLFNDGENIVGDKFYKKGFFNGIKEKFSSIFSKKYKKVLDLRNQIIEEYKNVENSLSILNSLGFKEFQLVDIKNSDSLLSLKNSILNMYNLSISVNTEITVIQENKKILEDYEEQIIELGIDKIFNFSIETFSNLGNIENVENYFADLRNICLNTQTIKIKPGHFFNQKKCENIEKLGELINEREHFINGRLLNMQKFGFEGYKIQKINEIDSLEKGNEEILKILDEFRNMKFKIDSIKKIKEKLDNLFQDLAKILSDKIYNIKFKDYSSFKDIKGVKNYCIDIYDSINDVKQHLDSYESYHNWKFFELKREKNESRLLLVFKQIPYLEWVNIFKAWYYNGALLKYEQNSEIGFNKSDKKLQQLAELYQNLKIQQLKLIENIWGNKRNSKFDSLSLNFSTLYNLRKNRTFGHCNSLRRIIEKDLDLFLTIFPIVLTNPNVVNAIFPLKQGLFEVVIFDEASQLRISDTFTSLIRGQYKIIAGDKHQMPPSNYFQSISETSEDEQEEIFQDEEEQNILAESESLLQYAEDLQNVSKSYLDYHYRSEHPALIDFSNHAFYGGNLIPFPSREVYKPIDFRPVNGRYENRTNLKEIEEIIKILTNEIHENQNGKYPSIGIATFNINQRNLIIETINKIAESNIAFTKKFQALKEQGLFVKNLENIQGDEKDIIIISTTYGIGPNGKFSQNFARLNRIEGYKLLNVLITRAKQKLFLCTSIPKDKYLSYNDEIQNEGNNKKGILYAYLAYAEAVSNNDDELAKLILQMLREKSYESPRISGGNTDLSESPFEEEVYEELLEHFDEDNIIQQYKIGGFRLDFIIKTRTKDIVLECDGKAYHQTDEAYAYDIYRQKQLEDMGYVVYRIWSTNWFQDKDIEIRKFLDFVEQFEK